jgi:exodeoxyribonuclease VIII
MCVSEYRDAETGIVVPVKILVDLAPRPETFMWGCCLGDLKTCQNAGKSWARKVFELSYHVQAAFYLDVWEAATGEKRTEFFHVVQESFPPWEPARKILSAEFIELGRWRYQEALNRYAKCLSAGEWPGYGQDIVQPEPWMLT